MKSTVALIFAIALAVPASAKNFGALNIGGFGTVYVVGQDWNGDFVSMDGDQGFSLNGGGRIYFASTPSDGFDPNMYWQTNLNDMHFSYTIDISRVGCHCNSAGYFINMPGNSPGNDGDYYCDANNGNGIWCPEYDTWEGNMHTMAATLHTCNGGGGYWDYCDQGGCQTNSYNVDSNMLCPEDRCTINTMRPFTISHYQNNGQINVYMEQEGREASFNVCNDGGYISNMATSFGGMVFSASLWGGNGIDMSWLDGMTGCGGDCDIYNSAVKFSNFQLF